MPGFMFYCFVIATIFDGLTTTLGVAAIVGADQLLDYLFCAVGGFIVLGFSLGAKNLFEKKHPVYTVLKCGFWIAIAVDIYTSFMGSASYVVLKRSLGETINIGIFGVIGQLRFDQGALLFLLTLLMSSGPIAISFLGKEDEITN